MREIQTKVGVKADGKFGPITARAIMAHLKLSREEASHLLGQMAHETKGFRSYEENLNYSALRLAQVWPLRYSINPRSLQKEPNQLALRIQRNPVLIGSNVYANRMGNGNEASQEGFKFRGRGSLHITGKNNFEKFAKWINDPEVLNNPCIVATKYVLESGLFYFNENNLFRHCKTVNDKSIEAVSRGVNLGSVMARGLVNGLDDRRRWTYMIYLWLK